MSRFCLRRITASPIENKAEISISAHTPANTHQPSRAESNAYDSERERHSCFNQEMRNPPPLTGHGARYLVQGWAGTGPRVVEESPANRLAQPSRRSRLQSERGECSLG